MAAGAFCVSGISQARKSTSCICDGMKSFSNRRWASRKVWFNFAAFAVVAFPGACMCGNNSVEVHSQLI